MRTLKSVTAGLALMLVISSVTFAQSNPCNPCGGKNMKSMGDHKGQVFSVEDPMGRNTVTFKSTAPLEDIVGTSNQITGQLAFDPNNPNAGGHGELVVPVKSLESMI